jgi:hypothetical protein
MDTCRLTWRCCSQPFDLSDLDNCEVLLLDQSDQVQVDNLSNCRVFIGALHRVLPDVGVVMIL